MDMVAGLGGMMGQLAVGIAGGVNGDTGAVMAKMQGLAKTKSTIDSLPDKVNYEMFCINYLQSNHFSDAVKSIEDYFTIIILGIA